MARLAFFDLDGTLADRQSALSDVLTRLCRSHAFSPDAEQWLRAALADRATVGDFARLRESFGLEVSAADLWQEYVDLMAAAVTCRPEVLDGLARLRAAAWTIGVITNGAGDIQRAKLAGTGLADLVDGVAASGDLEIRKPDRRLFELGATRCGVSLADGGWMVGDFTDRQRVHVGADQGIPVEEQSVTTGVGWMIGDSVEADVLGGKRAGLNTIWISHGRAWPLKDEAPDFIVDDVADALEILLSLNGE